MASCLKTLFAVGTETVRTQPLLSGNVCRMLPAIRWPLGVVSLNRPCAPRQLDERSCWRTPGNEAFGESALSFKPLSAHWEDEQVPTDLLTSAKVSRSTVRSCLTRRVSNELRRTATTAHAMFLLPNVLTA